LGLGGLVVVFVVMAFGAALVCFLSFWFYIAYNSCNIPVVHNHIGSKYGRDNVSLVITAADSRLNVGGVTIAGLRAADSVGTSCPWKTRELPDKYGNPRLCIEIDSRAAKDVLTATGDLRYKGITYFLDAKWEAAPDKSGKDATDYWRLVRCELQKKEGAGD
jgi:hypothetical protein